MPRCPPHSLPRRLGLAWLLLCLLLAQTTLLLHRVAHAQAETPFGTVTRPAQEGAGSDPLEALFGAHTDTADCLNFDHACGGDAAPAPTLALAPVRPAMAAAHARPWHFHRPAPANYDARGPPAAP